MNVSCERSHTGLEGACVMTFRAVLLMAWGGGGQAGSCPQAGHLSLGSGIWQVHTTDPRRQRQATGQQGRSSHSGAVGSEASDSADTADTAYSAAAQVATAAWI